MIKYILKSKYGFFILEFNCNFMICPGVETGIRARLKI